MLCTLMSNWDGPYAIHVTRLNECILSMFLEHVFRVEMRRLALEALAILMLVLFIVASHALMRLPMEVESMCELKEK